MLNEGTQPLEEAGHRETSWLDPYLPDGFLGNASREYLQNLPNVREHPLTTESFWEAPRDSWAQYTASYFLLYPWLVLLLLLLGGGVWLLTIHVLRKRELARREPCPVCSSPVYPCARFCPSCSTKQLHPVSLNIMGFSRLGSPAVKGTHSDLLRSYRRCPRCASELPKNTPGNHCPVCHTALFPGTRSKRAYDHYIQKRFWRVFLLLSFTGLIPVIGSLLAISLYRRRLIAPYAHYLSRVTGGFFMTIPSLLRYLFSFVPFIGIIGIPLLALSENLLYRRAFLLGRRISSRHARSPHKPS